MFILDVYDNYLVRYWDIFFPYILLTNFFPAIIALYHFITITIWVITETITIIFGEKGFIKFIQWGIAFALQNYYGEDGYPEG